jgi:hypothetical protein
VSFAAPLWLAVAAAVAAGVVIAHLFSTSVPPRDLLPTVRFIPEGAPLAVLRTRRLSDLLLLLLRLLAVALLGLALAGARVPHRGPARVVVVDASRAVRSMDAVRDSALAVANGGALVVFDSAARRVTPDSLRVWTASGARGSLSAGLVAAHRELKDVTADRDDVELVVVSPAVREEVDSATSRLLALWEGPVRVVRVDAAVADSSASAQVRATGDDPLAAVNPRSEASLPRSASEGRNLQSTSNVRVIRTMITRADSLWARDSGGVLVLWPADNGSDVLLARTTPDSQGGITSSRDVVIATFAREHQPRPGRVLVRWLDGEPAATELPLGSGCVREVAIPVDPVGDMALRESFRGVVRSLLEPCGGARDFRPAPDVILSRAATKNLLSATKILRGACTERSECAQDDRLGLWLALLALGTLVAEQLLRSRKRADP